jgi:ABC-type glycerol-3-phosphate transport system substrate-binding protein
MGAKSSLVSVRDRMRLDARLGNGCCLSVMSKIRWAVLIGTLTGVSGCAESPATVTLEVYTWWQQPSEAEAFEAVRQLHRSKHENVELKNIGDSDSGDTRALMARGLLAGDPPQSFLANVGADLLGWAVADTQINPERNVLEDDVDPVCWIHDVSDILGDRTDLGENLLPGLRDHLVAKAGPNSTSTRFYGVPINVHRLNVIYYHRDALGEFEDGRNDGKKLLDIDTLCPVGDYDPWHPEYDLGLDIVIGAGKQAFTIVLLTFENVLPAIARRNGRTAGEVETFYNELFRGDEPLPRDLVTGASTDVREALKCVQYLSQWFRSVRIDDPQDPDDEEDWAFPSDTGWAKAVTEVTRGQGTTGTAAFTVMGDWANGLLANLESEAVESEPFPGTEELFVYTSDTFALPVGTAHVRETENLLETIASRDAQLAFSAKKGSIPARDVDPELLDLGQRETAAAFKESRRLLANSGWFPPYYPQDDLQAALIAMTDWDVVRPDADPAERERRLDAALRVFTDLEPILKHWQDRLDEGAVCPQP